MHARLFRRWHKPARQCSFVMETWGPHEGCAEFMSTPEVHECREPAVYVVKSFFKGLSWEPDRGITKAYSCAMHVYFVAEDAETHDTDVRAYRFRRLPGGRRQEGRSMALGGSGQTPGLLTAILPGRNKRWRIQ